MRNLTIRNFKDDLSYTKAASLYKLADLTKKNEDATTRGMVAWSNSEVSQLLLCAGLPDDSALSVLVVEFLPAITSIYDAVSELHRSEVNDRLRQAGTHPDLPATAQAGVQMGYVQNRRDLSSGSPASDQLGEQRILRTSPLTEVPFVCCPAG